MTVCQTCGDEGFSKLLIPCEQCHNVLVHRYCVDGPSNIDDDEVSWSCEDCVPRVPPPIPAIRKSERICLITDREVQRKKARKNWRNYSSVSKFEESNYFVAKGADKVVDDKSNLDDNKDVLVSRKQGSVKEDGIISKSGRNHSNAFNVEKTSCEGKGADKVVNDESHLDEHKDGMVSRKEERLKENNVVSKNGRNPSNASNVEKTSDTGKGANNVVDNSTNLDEKEVEITTKKERNHVSVSIVEKPICLGLKAIVVGDESSNLHKKKNTIVKRKQVKVEGNGVASNNGGSEPDLQTRRKTMGSNFKDAENKNSSVSSLLTGQKTEDLSNLFINGKDMQKKLEMNLDTQLSNGPGYCLESTSKADEIDGDSVRDKLHKHGESFSEVHSSNLENQQRIGNSESAKQPDRAEEKVSDNIQATKAVSVSHLRSENQSGFSIYELQTPRKKRRMVIAMEYSDSDEEPSYVRHEHAQVVPDAGKDYYDTSSGEPLVKKGEYGLTQESFLKSDDSFPTYQSPIQTDNHMLTQTSSIGCKNHDPQLPAVILDYYIPAQPMIDAVWRGHCSINNHKSLSFGLEARLSNKAHAFVHGVASALPNLLRFEIMQKQHVWPKRFQDSPPTGDAIGLYFFPIEERDEKSYTLLLDEMIECDLALKFHINNLELLVFCSLELPVLERRFQTKYYMWGVFKRKQETSSTSQPSDNRIRKYSAVPCINRSSVSPSSVDNHSVINSSNSHLYHKAGNRVELTPSIRLKHLKPANNE